MESKRHVWVRAETKEFEQRTPLSPESCKTLLSSEPSWKVTVERSSQRIFKDQEYEDVGCEMVDLGAWALDCPIDSFVLGLKELPDGDQPLSHTHIYFGHCYKEQEGWMELLNRFCIGQGTLLDVEFMVDKEGKRAVAVFGQFAGFVGASVGIDVWCHQHTSPDDQYPPLMPFSSADELTSSVKGKVDQVFVNCHRDPKDPASYPKIMVIGALGRCGRGAVDAALKIGIPDECITKWDIEETPKTGPIPELLKYDILVNCIFLDPNAETTPLFVTKDLIHDAGTDRKLKVICDVSCDTSNPKNPLPIYSSITSFLKPTIRVDTPPGDPPLDIVAIDHLPSLLPRESSLAFSEKMLPYVQELPKWQENEVWQNAKKAFDENVLKMDEYHPKSRRRNCTIL